MRIKHFSVLSALSFSFAFTFSGCIGPGNLPQATTAKVKPSDILGKWQYEAERVKAVVTLNLHADGSFTQTIQPKAAGEIITHKGKWVLNGSDLKLESVLKMQYDGTTKPAFYSCWVIDDTAFGQGPPFAILGGDSFNFDVDTGDTFERVP